MFARRTANEVDDASGECTKRKVAAAPAAAALAASTSAARTFGGGTKALSGLAFHGESTQCSSGARIDEFVGESRHGISRVFVGDGGRVVVSIPLFGGGTRLRAQLLELCPIHPSRSSSNIFSKSSLFPLAVRGDNARNIAVGAATSYMLHFVLAAAKSSVVNDRMTKTMYGGKLNR